jgi:hypothetical protein
MTSPWFRVPIGPSDPDELGELAGGWGIEPLMHPDEPATTADLAAVGKPVGTADDLLIVVATLRCARYGHKLGAMLHLDRQRRGLPPLLLADLCRSNEQQ